MEGELAANVCIYSYVRMTFRSCDLDLDPMTEIYELDLEIRKTYLHMTSSSATAERPRELGDFKKARANGGTNNHSLKDSHKCLRYTADRPASYGNQFLLLGL